MFNSNNRVSGVMVADTQKSPRGKGSPNTVAHAIRCNMVAVQYFDEYGAEKATVVLEVGNKLYNPPNSEEWAAALRGTQKWFQEAVFSRLPKAGAESAPVKDNVEILVKAASSDATQEVQEATE